MYLARSFPLIKPASFHLPTPAPFETGPSDAIDRNDWTKWRLDDSKAARKESLVGMTHWSSPRLDHRPLPGGVRASSLHC